MRVEAWCRGDGFQPALLLSSAARCEGGHGRRTSDVLCMRTCMHGVYAYTCPASQFIMGDTSTPPQTRSFLVSLCALIIPPTGHRITIIIMVTCRYAEDMELEDAIHTALLTLREGFEGG